ncbi:ABC transporter substrate-binding protein [Halomarina oriensis]|uniref:ABC transporter substrate-binding protein n=1 Tax=Halomarina oriensis TaxID=671145 RepID=A0A6B0GMU9_9EURY|nr:ABC transporter substrate-binding protein [Halomarina oriensis]MWG34957.1 ABC transporter substrate-binding protein [Halomarina oriensis]
MADTDTSRRTFLKAAGSTAAVASIAGCLGGDGGGEGDDSNGSGDGNGSTDGGGGGGGGGGQSGGTLVYSRGDHPTNYDPQQTTSGEVAKVTNQIFNQLIQFVPGGGGELEAGLATEYSLEGTTATLTLREGATFHNGEEFTAADFEATYRRFVDEDYEYYLGTENASGYGPFTLGSWIDSVNVQDDYNLELELTQEYAPFLRNLAMFAASVLSRAQIESLGADPASQVELGQEPVGTGPFTFEQMDNSNQRVQLVRNEEYWGETASVDQVIFNTIPENSTRAQSVVNGDSHIIDGIGAQASQQIQNADSATLAEKDGINVGYMAFNMARFEAFRDAKVRQAISYAINTQAIVEQIYEGFASQADQPIPPNVLGYNEELDPYPQDKEQAQSLLEEAGQTDFSFELATFSNPRGYNPSPVNTAQQVKSDLADVGLEVSINQFSTFSSYLDYTDQGKHDACFLGWYTDNADPDNFFYALLHPQVDRSAIPEDQDWVGFDTEGYNTLNVSAWANSEYMDLVEQGQATYDEGQRRSLYQDAAQIAHDQAPWVFIDYAKTLRGVNQAVAQDSYTVSSVGGPYLNTVQLNQ